MTSVENGENGTERGVAEWIVDVAVAVEEPEVFQERAKAAALALGDNCIESLPQYFHNSPAKPVEAEDRFTGLGHWMAVCQRAIFEILYALREPSLPLLRRVAFGEYDWTQANAIEILCRFGIDGLEREAIAKDLAREMTSWRYEALQYSLESLAQFAPYAPPVAQRLRTLVNEWAADDPIEAMGVVEKLVRHAPKISRIYAPLVRDIMRVHGRKQRHPLLDGYVMQGSIVDGVEQLTLANSEDTLPPKDFHAIRAAFLLRELLTGDKEADACLQEWAKSHPHEAFRKQIAERLATGV